MPKFKNRENECVKTVDGRKVWLSRSCAVAITLIFTKHKDNYSDRFYRNEAKVLLVKRVDKMDTEPGKYCLPCGYLDYDESLTEAAIREVYEETGLHILNCNFVNGMFTQPWYVSSKPQDDALQNVTHHFGGLVSYVEEPTFKEQDEEISWVGLVPIKDLDNYDIAFNHETRIQQFVQSLE